jgi:Spy/CpxP family protein refolding chaperone
MTSSQSITRRIRAVAAALALGAFGTLLAGCTGAPAQTTSAPSAASPDQPQRGNRFGKVLLSLNLSDDQKAQIRTIMADARTQAKAETDPQARRAKMRAAFAKVQDVLTPAQRDQLKEKMTSMRRASPPPQ